MSRARAARADHVGMAVFLASWSMLLVALCFAALAMRRAGVWQPLALDVNWLLPAAATLAVAASSVALWRGHSALAVVCGLIFFALQLVLMERASEIGAARGRELLWLLVGFHGAHVFIGGAGLLVRRARGRRAGLWIAYWHALAIAWLVIVGVLFG